MPFLSMLTPTQFKLIMGALALAAAAGVGFWGAWTWQENSYEKDIATLKSQHEKFIGDVREEGTAAILREKSWYEQTTSALQQQSDAWYEEYVKAKAGASKRTTDIASGATRVLVPVVKCTTATPRSNGVQSNPGTTSDVHDGAGTAQLEPAFAGRLIGYTDEGDSYGEQLLACRAWVKTLVASRKPAKK